LFVVRPATRKKVATAARSRLGANGRAAKSAARRDAILAAALDEFAARGFADARLDDVAKRAGVAKGTIYLHFRDKQALFQEIVRSILSPTIATLEAALGADMPVRVVAQRLVEVFVRDVLGTRRKDVIRLIISEGARFPELAEFYYREVLSRVLAAIRALMQRAVDRGEIGNEAILRFPQLLGAPAIVAIIWNSLFEKFEPLDAEAFMRAYLDLVFTERSAA
jgi:AcrR family transcriptional regulator